MGVPAQKKAVPWVGALAFDPPSHWELERDARGQGFQNSGLTSTLVQDRLTVDRRTRTQPGVRCRAQTGAPATDQTDSGLRGQKPNRLSARALTSARVCRPREVSLVRPTWSTGAWGGAHETELRVA